MADFVLDANVIFADLTRERASNQGSRAKPYLDQVRAGTAKAHIPTLMLIEVCGALTRQVSTNMAEVARQTFEDWQTSEKLLIYALDAARMQKALSIAIRYGLKGSDAVYVALSDELVLPLVTFDEDSLATPLQRGGYARVVVPS